MTQKLEALNDADSEADALSLATHSTMMKLNLTPD